MFQWLANCGIEDSVSMHVNVLRQNYNLTLSTCSCNALQYSLLQRNVVIQLRESFLFHDPYSGF